MQPLYTREQVEALLDEARRGDAGPSENEQWIKEAVAVLDRLSSFLQHINAPHHTEWQEWIASAESMINAERAARAALAEALRGMVVAHAIPSSICKERPAYEAAIAALAAHDAALSAPQAAAMKSYVGVSTDKSSDTQATTSADYWSKINRLTGTLYD
jgi:hypothetical protein